MKKIHLRIHYGPDERFDMICRTVLCSYQYFTSVRILNLGPDENSKRFEKLNFIPNLEIMNFGKHYHMCENDDSLRTHYIGTNDGDWLIWLDTDWRLPEYFLENMQNEIEKCESEGLNCIYSYQLGHHIISQNEKWTSSGQRNLSYTQEDLNFWYDKWRKEPQHYGWPLLQKVDKYNTHFTSFLGNHPHQTTIPIKRKIIPEMYHLHFRNFGEKAYCGTNTYLCWWYLGHHVFKTEEQIEIQNSKEFKDFNEFKSRHRCFTSNQLHSRIKNNDTEFIEDMRKLFLSFKDTNIFSCKQMYRLANEFDMEFYKVPSEPVCNNICCTYKGRSISEITI